MANEEILFSRGSFVVEKSTDPKPDVVDMLANTVWGMPGGTLFRHLDTYDTLPYMHEPVFISLRKEGLVNGVLSFSRRKVQVGSTEPVAYYIKHLCFAENLRTLSDKQKKAGDKELPPLKSNGFIRKLILDILKNPARLDGRSGSGQPAFFYAYAEAGNERSLQMCNAFGFIPGRELSTVAFSRLNPQKNENVSTIDAAEKTHVLSRLKNFYRGHSLFFDAYIFQQNDYFVIRQGGKIVAGVQARMFHWQVAALPGLSGRIILKLMPHLPWISKLFNPADWRFGAFEAFFYEEGHEQALEILFESVLAALQLHAALIWMDKDSPWHAVLRDKLRLGLLNKIKSNVPVQLIALPAGIASADLELVKNQPAYVSAFDLS